MHSLSMHLTVKHHMHYMVTSGNNWDAMYGKVLQASLQQCQQRLVAWGIAGL